MKNLVLAGLVAVVPVTANATYDIKDIYSAIRFLSPAQNSRDSQEIAYAVYIFSSQDRLDWKVVLAILEQESTLQRDPQDCLHKPQNCKDFGIAQINFKTWGDKMHLSKSRLSSDYFYNIGVAAQILSYYHKHYGNREASWFTRYHSATPEYRLAYLKSIQLHYVKIESYLRMRNERRYQETERRISDNYLYRGPEEGLRFGRRSESFHLFRRSYRKIRQALWPQPDPYRELREIPEMGRIAS